MSEPNRFVGKNKTKADINNRSSLTKPRGEEGQQGDIVNQVKEFQEWADPNFNVLIVQTPRPSIFDAPLLSAFSATLRETEELLKSMARFGLPHTSVRNKCPYWREDRAPLDTNPSVRLQRAIKLMECGPRHTRRSHHGSHQGLDPHLAMHSDGGSTRPAEGMHPLLSLGMGMHHHHGHGGGHSTQRFVFSEDTSLMFSAALNLAVWWFINMPPKTRPIKP